MTPTITAILDGKTPVTVTHSFGDGYVRVRSMDGTLFRNWVARTDPEVAPYPAATDDPWTDVPMTRLSDIQEVPPCETTLTARSAPSAFSSSSSS